MISRREFVTIGATLGAGVMLPLGWADKVFAFNLLGQALPLKSTLIPKYVDALSVMGAIDATGGGVYEIQAVPGVSNVSSGMAAALTAAAGGVPTTYGGTSTWSYRATGATTALPGVGDTYLGPTVVTLRGTPVSIKWHNNLKDLLGNPIPHPLAVDPSLHWAAVPAADQMMMGPFPVNAKGGSTFAYTLQSVPMAPHVHGGEQHAGSDGGPEVWFTPDSADVGPMYPYAGQGAGGDNTLYTYSLHQDAAPLWYHDHALGLTRLNVYMGLAGGFLILDPANEPAGLPAGQDGFGTDLDLPLIIQDRMFDVTGQFYYPAIAVNPVDHPFWVPEFFGDTMLVNGKVWPYLDVEPRAYRFRIFNGSNARFYAMYLWNLVTGTTGPVMNQIATDTGYLYQPVTVGVKNKAPLRMGTGERAEVVVDFSAYAGQTLTLLNNSKAPFPNGAPADPKTVGQIMQFRVRNAAPTPYAFPVNPLNPGLASFAATGVPTLGTAPAGGGVTRVLTLNEIMGPGGPLEVLVNQTKWMAPITENPKKGTTEIWKIVNMTADTHPIHLHLVSFQLVSRQPYDVGGYAGAFAAVNGMMAIDGMMTDPATGLPRVYQEVDPTPFLKGKVTLADPNERGWKDTLRMNPGEVTTIVVRFAPVDSALSDYPFDATAMPGYVWHCHIIDHEDNEMMRPFMVTP